MVRSAIQRKTGDVVDESMRGDWRKHALGMWKRVAAAPSTVLLPRRPRPVVMVFLILTAAIWGKVVDSPLLPTPTFTGNSTLFQASTAAPFAIIGILYGPLPGALCGLVRDGSSYVVQFALSPGAILHHGFWQWSGKAAMDTLEDVVLGLAPALVARYTRRLGVLSVVSAGMAWLSLPLLVTGDMLIDGQGAQLWPALTARSDNWYLPADPGLLVYGLATGALTALALAPWTTRPRVSLSVGLVMAALAAALIALGATA